MAFKDWTKFVWEDDKHDAPPPAAKPILQQQQQANPAVAAFSQSMAGSAAAPNPAYDTLLSHTQFESTDAGKVYRKYYDKLTRISDEHLRQVTALDLASNDNVDQRAILAAFDQLEQQLQHETDHFNEVCDARMKQDCTDPKAKLDQLTAQIDELQKQKDQISAQLQPALDRLRAVQVQFQTAWERRKNELKAQRQSFTGAN